MFHYEMARYSLNQAIAKTRQNYPFEAKVFARKNFCLETIEAWVLLPDHLHCIWTLPSGNNDFSIRWNLIKSRFSKSVKSSFHRIDWTPESKQKHRETTIWQRRFWEHQIRDEQDYQNHFDYINSNPVKQGWVKQVKDWPYSTFHSYVKKSFYPACGEKTFVSTTEAKVTRVRNLPPDVLTEFKEKGVVKRHLEFE